MTDKLLSSGSLLGPYRHEVITQDEMAAFAEILRDPNPIHLDESAVRALGLGERTINQGPANMGYIVNMLMEAVPAAHISHLSLRFGDIVRQGDTAVAGGVIDSIEQTDGRRWVRCSVWLDVEPGRRALSGTATLGLRTTPRLCDPRRVGVAAVFTPGASAGDAIDFIRGAVGDGSGKERRA